MIYLDNASTTIIDEDVFNEMLPYFNKYYFNASSNHKEGAKIKKAIELSRNLCAKLINANPNEIIFTSGATESINYALKGYLEANFDKGNHIITCKTEHKAVLQTCEYLETKGVDVTYLDVDINGCIDLTALEIAITSSTCLIAIMFANNETGVLQDIQAIGDIAKKYNIKFFCDATQAIGKIEIDVNKLGIDMLCMSSHKINGPKGTGFLYVKEGIELTPLIHGGTQENNNRGGTYNTPLIIGLGKSCQLALDNLTSTIRDYKILFEYLLELLNNTNNIQIIGDKKRRLYNIINLKITNLDASIFIESNNYFAVSNGAACTSRVIEGSHVLKAMGLTEYECNECLRISFDKHTTKNDIKEFINNFI